MLPQTRGGNYIALRAAGAFFRHQHLFWIAMIGITALVTTALTLRNKSFTATASTQVVAEQEVASALGFTKTSYISPAQQNINRFKDLLKDNEPGGFLDSSLKSASLKSPISVAPNDRDPRFKALNDKLSFNVESDDVFSLYLTWDDSQECERILRALRDGYIEEAGLSRQASSIATANFLDTQIQMYQRRMRVAEQALIEYKQKNLGQLPEAQTAEIEQMSGLKQQRDNLRVTSQDASLKQAAIESRLAKIKSTTIFEQVVDNASKPDSPATLGLRDLENRRTALLSEGWLPTSTKVRDIDAKIDAAERRVAQEEKAAVATNPPTAPTAGGTGTGFFVSGKNVVQTTTQENPEYRNLMEKLTQAKIDQTTSKARMALLDQQIAGYEQRLKALPAAARVLTDKTRDYSILKEQYEDLLTRREQARIKASLDKVAATSTLQPIGVVYAVPTMGAKKMALLVAGSMIFGGLVGFGLIVCAEWADPTIRYNADVERLLGVPVIAGLPLIKARASSRQISGGEAIPLLGAVHDTTVSTSPLTGLNP
jgi:uncharacterized protein involved in exopolysaccharide biosynthesis